MEPSPEDRKDRWTCAVVAASLGGAAYLLSRVLPFFPGMAEAALGGGRAALPARLITRASSLVPFSIAELLIGGYALWLVVLCVRTARRIRRRDTTLPKAARNGVRRVLLHGGVATVAFYCVWGFNYARPSLAERAGWPEWVEPSLEELSDLTRAAVLAANSSYEQLHGSSDSGTPTAFPSEASDLESAMREGSKRALEFLPVGQSGGRPMPKTRVKRPVSTGLIARLGMAGVFFPLTAEPHVVRGLPAASAVQSFAHERAHLWGFANEAEASYAGYLSNALSPDPLLRYAAALFAANQLLRALGRVDREEALALRREFSAGIERDLDDIRDYWRPYRGVGQLLGSAVNDRYLRANRVAAGVGSYGRASRLLVELARQHGGLVPSRGQAPS